MGKKHIKSVTEAIIPSQERPPGDICTEAPFQRTKVISTRWQMPQLSKTSRTILANYSKDQSQALLQTK